MKISVLSLHGYLDPVHECARVGATDHRHAAPNATTTIDGRYLPPPDQPFQREINLNAEQSKPA